MGKKILFIVILLAAIIMEETAKAYAKGVSLMKKILFISILLVSFLISGTVVAYDINDPIGDQIGTGFEGYGIDIKNFTPGYNSGHIIFDLYTDYPQSGITVGSWVTEPADIFMYENYYGNEYIWAIPLINHGTFFAGGLYAVGDYLTSDDFDPSPGSYNYNHDVPVRISSLGNNYGNGCLSGGIVTWNSLPGGSPDYRVSVQTGFYEDDPNASITLKWGAATCANDVIEGSTAPVPEPATMFLLGSGLLAFAGFRRKIRRKN